jgi:poly-gamma-glutamate capsule biosynthesis protein CapA/YwtB (metallophosphatase superfamily)
MMVDRTCLHDEGVGAAPGRNTRLRSRHAKVRWRIFDRYETQAKHLIEIALALSLTGVAAAAQECPGCADSEPRSVTIAAVGDTNGYNIIRQGQSQTDPLGAVRDLLGEREVLVFNFEGTLLSEEPQSGTCIKFPRQSLFHSSPAIADFLHPTRHTIATLANNHILDCGASGIEQTVRELTGRGITTVGAGQNVEEACKPVRLQVDGVGLAIVAYLAMEPNRFAAGLNRAGAATWEACDAERQLAELAATGDIVVVSLHLHLGPGWSEQALPSHIALVRRALASGADVVIAHGPHVAQGIIQSEGGLGLPSLGNFLFRPDYQMPDQAHRSIMAKITVSPGSIQLALLPLRIKSSGRPRPASASEASEILGDIAALSAELGTTAEIREGMGYVTIQRRR